VAAASARAAQATGQDLRAVRARHRLTRRAQKTHRRGAEARSRAKTARVDGRGTARQMRSRLTRQRRLGGQARMYRLKTSMEPPTDGGPKDARHQPLIRENAPYGTKFFRDRRPDRGLSMAAPRPLFGATPRAKSDCAPRPARLPPRSRANGGAASRETRNPNFAPLENSAVHPTTGWQPREQPRRFYRRLRTTPVVHATTRPRPTGERHDLQLLAHRRATATAKLSPRRPPAQLG
jgi:hypothetical protein